MAIPVFLSHPRPFNNAQAALVEAVRSYFAERDLEPRTLGVDEYDTEVPLASIRRLMLECNGVLVLALKRYEVITGREYRPPAAEGVASIQTPLDGEWLTSPWCQVEAGMGFQLGLPVLVFRESGVRAEGVLEQGVMASYMPEIALDGPLEDFLTSKAWRQLISRFEADVRELRRKKGIPSLLQV